MTKNQNSTSTSNILPRRNDVKSTDLGEMDTSGSAFMGLESSCPILDIPIPPTASSSRRPGSPEQKSSSTIHLKNLNSQKGSQQSSLCHSTEVQFRSALSYTEVRDYAYPEFHPLHYGVPNEPEDEVLISSEEYENEEYPDSYMRDGGPPWKEDPDLASPVIISHSVGDRISREYEFSVASADEIHGRAVALFDFIPENDNEAPLKEGQVIWVSYRHGQGWLVAEDPSTGETGLVPEGYVQMISSGHEYSSFQSSAGINDSIYDTQNRNGSLNEQCLTTQTQQLVSGDGNKSTPHVKIYAEESQSYKPDKSSETDSESWVDESATSEEEGISKETPSEKVKII